MFIAANWKAYVETSAKAKALFAAAKRLSSRPNTQIALIPPAPFLGLLAPGNRSKVAIGVQDISEGTGGAATGEITASIAAGLGATYAIVGHSERRTQGETDAQTATKTQRALAQGLTPILCVGERERDGDARYLGFIRAEIATVFSALVPQERTRVIIAYEPIWAIGKTAAEAITPHDLLEMVLYIRKILGEYVSAEAAQQMKVLYGGSVESANARTLAAGSGIDGFLVGHASTDVKEFSALVKAL